ncbi:hypothetical protein PSH76_15540 [Pseudomonas sp. FP215]|uniref:hypothetical protein n=1 Tax=Pseudomonas TaxID=286 RepID=UPI002735C905|nr:hypothetical protein [Pseudomonas sp. FP215]WLH21490.1 hypothetical protein PSH76_15540 [Pseudomonas sp. FP215]
MKSRNAGNPQSCVDTYGYRKPAPTGQSLANASIGSNRTAFRAGTKPNTMPIKVEQALNCMGNLPDNSRLTRMSVFSFAAWIGSTARL